MTSIHKLPASLIGKMENDWKYHTPSELIRDWPFVNVPTYDDDSNPFCWAEISKETLEIINANEDSNPQGFKGTDDESRFLNALHYEIKPIDIDTFNSFDKDKSVWDTLLVFPEYKYNERGGHTPKYRFARMMMAFYLAKQSKVNRVKIEEDFNNPLLVVDAEREGYKSMILHIWYLSMNWFIECPVESLDEAWLAFKNGTTGIIKDIKVYIENTDSYGSSTYLLNAWNNVYQRKYATTESFFEPSAMAEMYIGKGLMSGNKGIHYGKAMKKYADVVNPKRMSYGAVMGVINHYDFGTDFFDFKTIPISTKNRFTQ